MRKIVMTDKADVARHTIQVTLEYRPRQFNILAVIQLWRKGGYFGTADEMLRLCPMTKCKGVLLDTFEMTDIEREWFDQTGIDPMEVELWPVETRARLDNWHGMHVLCPKCGAYEIRDRFSDSYVLNNTRDKIADAVEAFAAGFNYDCDVFMVVPKQTAALSKAKADFESHKDHGQYLRALDKGRERYEVFYSKRDIMRDIAAGKTMRSCIIALLRA